MATASMTLDLLRSLRNPALAEAENALAEAQERLGEVERETVKNCKHKHIAQAPFYDAKWLSSMPPFRVCLECGLYENGWGTGYHKLRGRDAYGDGDYQMSRDEAYGFRTIEGKK